MTSQSLPYNPPIPPLQPGTTQPSGQQWQPQSPGIMSLKRQMERVQLPPVSTWQDPSRVIVQSSKVVPGWPYDPGLCSNS